MGDQMHDDLAGVRVYGKAEQKKVIVWLAIRNHAAHADYGKYREPEVRIMIMGVREFIIRNPA